MTPDPMSDADGAPPSETPENASPPRRLFLKLGLLGGLVLGTGGLFAYRTSGYALAPAVAARLRHLSLKEASILQALALRIVAPDRPDLPTATEVDVVLVLDRVVADLHPLDRRDLGRLLQLLEHGLPWLAGHASRFTRLSPPAQDEVLAAMLSRLGDTVAGGFDVLKSLCVLAYYRHPRTWAALGYDGPRLGS